MRQKVYCGMKQVLPEGYDRFAIPYQCLKKGYGACLYANKRGTGYNNNKQWFFLLGMVMVFLFVGLLFLWHQYFSHS